MITEPYCSHCGTKINLWQAKSGQKPGTLECPTCLQDVQQPRASNPQTTQPQPHGADSPAWEGEGGVIGGLLKTVWQMMFNPGRTMAAPGKPGLVWALSFSIIICVFSYAFMKLGNVLMGWERVGGFSDLAGLIGLLLLFVVMLFVDAAVLHAFLWIFRGAKKGYRATFRALGYSYAPSWIMIIPAIGLPIATVWSACVIVGALAGAHGISRLRSFAAVFMPLILLFVLGLVLLLVFGIGMLQEIMREQGLEHLWTV